MDPDLNKIEKEKELEKKEVPKGGPAAPAQPTAPAMRKIVIATDGTNIKLESAEVSGQVELIATLENVVKYLKGEK